MIPYRSKHIENELKMYSYFRNILEVKNKLFHPPPRTVIYFYKIYQSEYDSMKKHDPSIIFIDKLPQNIQSFKSLISPYSHSGCIVCFDDYELEITENISFFHQIWTVFSHHLNVTPILILHNLFAKNLRTISLNTHRIVLTKSLRDSSQIDFLSRQCFPGTKNFLTSVYQKCLQMQDFPYLILNFTPGKNSDNYIKVFTRIFKTEYPMTVFRPLESSSRTRGNPYEQLVLIDQTLYDILTKEQTQLGVREITSNAEIDNSTANNSNIEIRNINEY